MQELIEQVKRIIGATGAEMAFPSERTKAALDAAIAEANFPALLAHLERTQAVVDAANTRKFWEGTVKAGLRGVANGTVRPETLDSAKVALDGATIALDAALEMCRGNNPSPARQRTTGEKQNVPHTSE